MKLFYLGRFLWRVAAYHARNIAVCVSQKAALFDTFCGSQSEVITMDQCQNTCFLDLQIS